MPPLWGCFDGGERLKGFIWLAARQRLTVFRFIYLK